VWRGRAERAEAGPTASDVAPETKKRLQEKLEGLLYRFRYTTLRTFGRDEIEFSMRVFDLFGRR
jgi:hypothetical protein